MHLVDSLVQVLGAAAQKDRATVGQLLCGSVLWVISCLLCRGVRRSLHLLLLDVGSRAHSAALSSTKRQSDCTFPKARQAIVIEISLQVQLIKSV